MAPSKENAMSEPATVVMMLCAHNGNASATIREHFVIAISISPRGEAVFAGPLERSAPAEFRLEFCVLLLEPQSRAEHDREAGLDRSGCARTGRCSHGDRRTEVSMVEQIGCFGSQVDAPALGQRHDLGE